MKNSLRHLISKKISSKYSGILEITRLNGKKILNSENANYSYGALEEVLDFGLAYAQAERSSNILILGLGGGSVIGLLRNKYKYYGRITAVEIDPAIIEIAIKEFRINQHPHLDLICEDALEYVNRSTEKFGFIIIDIFIDLEVPLSFYSAEFWENITRLSREGGTVLFNAGINKTENNAIDNVLAELKPRINFRKLDTGVNTLFILTKNPTENK